MENPSREFALPGHPAPAAGRRDIVRSFGAITAALLVALGVREGAAKQNGGSAGQHRNPDGHDHSKRGRRGNRGKAGSRGLPGTSGTPGAKGDKGEQGEKGDQGDPGPGTMLTATTLWRPGSLFPGESTSTMVEVPGAAEGDPVLAGLSSIRPAPFSVLAMPIYGHVMFPGSVTVTITNLALTGNETIPEGTLTVVVVKP